jgi:hypothetical protein
MSSYHEEYSARRPNGDAPLSPRELEESRQRVLDRLTEAFSSDHLSMEGYESRVAAVQTARTRGDLESLVADLPREAGKANVTRPSSRRRDAAAKVPLSNEIDSRLQGSGEESVACIMGERRLQGDWLQGDKVSSFCVMGSVVIDFRDTALPPGRIKLDTFCLMGDIKVTVPRGLPVKMSAFPFMADARIGREVERHIERGEPYLDISGFVMMGDIQVQVAD